MNMRLLPACTPRVDSGVVQFGDDWPGLFLRGDRALLMAQVLTRVFERLPSTNDVMSEFDRGAILGLASLCAEVEYRPTDTCPRCQGELQPGEALQNTLVGYPDFPGDDHAVTVSPTGPARMVPVLKCTSCGYSRTTG